MIPRMPSTPSVVVAVSLGVSVVATLVGCATRAGSGDGYPELGEYAGREIVAVDFTGGAPFDADSLKSIVATKATRCSFLGLPFCLPFTRLGRQRHEFSPGTVREDVNRLTLFYRREGYFGTTVRPAVTEDADAVGVTFEITRADPVVLAKLSVTGTEDIVDADSLARRLPSRPGQIFDLGDFAASADTVLSAVQELGHARAELLRSFNVDRTTNRATATLDVIAGPVVEVDSIVVEGAEGLGRRAALRQLAVKKDDVLRISRLAESERNLYELAIVQFATVTVAPDSIQVAPADSSSATVLVRIAEATVHQVDAELGWGTVECFRALTRWESRNLAGGARQLVLQGSAGKIGIRQGLGGSVCSAFEADTFANTMDYGLAADLTQPWFLSPRNALTLNLWAERLSEPRVFLRESVGGRTGVTRRIGGRTYMDLGVEVERSSTLADPVLFCGAFLVCEPETIELLVRPRFRNALAAGVIQDHTDIPIDATRGHITRIRLAWAPAWMGSDVTFVRWTLDYSRYREVRPDVVAAFAIRIGDLFRSASPSSTDDFLPPEDRFFAGGANTVRGYAANMLGPGIYVTEELETDEFGEPRIDPLTGDKLPDEGAAVFVPTGGTSLLILNAELRMPSPVLSRITRMALFVDAGSVTTRQFWGTNLGTLKVTPGVGLRVRTPVGPVRVDLAYNPYSPPVAPLFLADPETDEIILIRDRFQAERGSFLRRFRIHAAVGQAF